MSGAVLLGAAKGYGDLLVISVGRPQGRTTLAGDSIAVVGAGPDAMEGASDSRGNFYFRTEDGTIGCAFMCHNAQALGIYTDTIAVSFGACTGEHEAFALLLPAPALRDAQGGRQ